MKTTLVPLCLITLAGGCSNTLDAGARSLAGTTSQGTTSQGTTSQGTTSQGTTSQGAQDAVWGFGYSGWSKNDMSLVSTSADNGRLSAVWGQMPSCTSDDRRLTRECEWYAGGTASCTPGTTIRVGAGGCGLGFSSADSMIRVCTGDGPCHAADAIAAATGTAPGFGCSASVYPSVSLVCPSSGALFVMVAPEAPHSILTPHFNFSVASSPGTSFNKAVTDKQFLEVELTGVRGPQDAPVSERYHIHSVTDDGDEKHYELRRVSDEQSLCMPSKTGDVSAIPFIGTWYDTFYRPSTTSFTFGCTAGAIAKCALHNYRPWAVHDGVSLRDYHQACTRAMRADFCGDGYSHTVTGTTIDLFSDFRQDPIGLPDTEDVEQDQALHLEVEAMWVRDTYPGSDDVWGQNPVACMAKKRWDTLPLNPCGPTVHIDPRDPKNTNAHYCDEVDVDTWLAGVFVLEATRSAYIDAGLWQWTHVDSQERRTTTKLTTTGGLIPGYAWPPLLLGAVYAPDTDPALRPATIPLYSYYNPSTGDYLTMTGAPPTGYGDRVFEGWIRDLSCVSTNTCPAKKLVLYSSGHDLVTTLAELVPAGTHTLTLGYLPR